MNKNQANREQPFAVLLVGHGSTHSAEVSKVVVEHAKRLRQRSGLLVEVAFWRGGPPLHDALQKIPAARIVIIPCLMSDGYFAREVFPRELGLRAPPLKWERAHGRSLLRTPPLGVWSILPKVILERVREVRTTHSPNASENASVLIVGHGTRRAQSSAESAQKQSQMLAVNFPEDQILPCYLDDSPSIAEALEVCVHRDVIVIPHLLAPGKHTGEDIPRALGCMPYSVWPQHTHKHRIWQVPETGSSPILSEEMMRIVNGLQRGAQEGNSPNEATHAA